MTSNKTKQYTENQYKRAPDPIMESGFINYDRLMVELNNRMHYDKETYKKFLNENGLIAEQSTFRGTPYCKHLAAMALSDCQGQSIVCVRDGFV